MKRFESFHKILVFNIQLINIYFKKYRAKAYVVDFYVFIKDFIACLTCCLVVLDGVKI